MRRGVERAPVATSPTWQEVATALATACWALGLVANHDLIAMLCAHSALETGHWKVMWNYNFGNVKATDAWIAEGGDFVFYPARPDGRANVSENLDDKWLAHVKKQARPRTDGGTYKGSNLDIHVAGKRDDGRWSVYFYPSHVQARFRAFPTLEAGAVVYVEKLTERYAEALHPAVAGRAAEYVNLLHAKGYFTAGLTGYRQAVQRLFKEYRSKVEAIELRDPYEQHQHPGPDYCA